MVLRRVKRERLQQRVIDLYKRRAKKWSKLKQQIRLRKLQKKLQELNELRKANTEHLVWFLLKIEATGPVNKKTQKQIESIISEGKKIREKIMETETKIEHLKRLIVASKAKK